MIQEACLICGGRTEAERANIVPFLVRRCQLDSQYTRSRYCGSCNFVFFERRLAPLEVKKLYAGYRGDEYNTMRLAYEPDYLSFVSVFSNPNSDYYRLRLEDYLRALSFFPALLDVPQALDFGGDGDLPARLMPNATIDYDDLSVGQFVNKGRYGIVFALQVFEHLVHPVEDLMTLIERLDDDGVVFLDIPIEYQGSLFDAWRLHGEVGGSLITMHEHINHFSASAVVSMLERVELVPFFQMVTRNPKLGITLAARASSSWISNTLEQQAVAACNRSSVLGRLW